VPWSVTEDRVDVTELLALETDMQLKPETQVFSLAQASEALIAFKFGNIRGANVLKTD
jgi:hypothetical protein